MVAGRERLMENAGLLLLSGAGAAAIGWAAAGKPAYAVIGLAAAVVAAMVLLAPEALLLLLVAALPWEGALDYPSESVSVVKILGGLLLLAWVWQAAQGGHRLVLSGALLPVGLF